MSKKIAVINYDVGNIFSLFKAIEAIGYAPVLIDNIGDLDCYGKAILPGVGAFDACYNSLLAKDYIDKIVSFAKSGKSLMGICVGMQLLFSKGLEGSGSPGLSIINGTVEEIKNTSSHGDFKLPHIGWNTIQVNRNKSLFANINNNEEFYFIHSFCVADINDDNLVLGQSNYLGNNIVSYVQMDNVFGCQFHPEKSRNAGLALLENFAKC